MTDALLDTIRASQSHDQYDYDGVPSWDYFGIGPANVRTAAPEYDLMDYWSLSCDPHALPDAPEDGSAVSPTPSDHGEHADDADGALPPPTSAQQVPIADALASEPATESDHQLTADTLDPALESSAESTDGRSHEPTPHAARTAELGFADTLEFVHVARAIAHLGGNNVDAAIAEIRHACAVHAAHHPALRLPRRRFAFIFTAQMNPMAVLSAARRLYDAAVADPVFRFFAPYETALRRLVWQFISDRSGYGKSHAARIIVRLVRDAHADAARTEQPVSALIPTHVLIDAAVSLTSRAHRDTALDLLRLAARMPLSTARLHGLRRNYAAAYAAGGYGSVSDGSAEFVALMQPPTDASA